jgi:uncharacterized damage-inducible protein DinB
MDKLIADIEFEFRRHKGLAERALGQLDDNAFFRPPAEHVNSAAVIVKHLAGNLVSRFTDFLTSDGDKASRDRDGEFVITESDTRATLMAAWERGWQALSDTLAQLQLADLNKSISIRGEAHTVQQALLRALTHTLYHVGQVTYIVRMLQPAGAWLTIAPGKSKEWKGSYLKK